MQTGAQQVLKPIQRELIGDQFFELRFRKPKRGQSILDKLSVLIDVESAVALERRQRLDKRNDFRRAGPDAERGRLVIDNEPVEREINVHVRFTHRTHHQILNELGKAEHLGERQKPGAALKFHLRHRAIINPPQIVPPPRT